MLRYPYKFCMAATTTIFSVLLMWCLMQAKSCVKPDYMSSQQDINAKMRAILIDWLIEVKKARLIICTDLELHVTNIFTDPLPGALQVRIDG